MEALKATLERGKVVVVVGAGISAASASVLTWRAAVESALSQLTTTDAIVRSVLSALWKRLEDAGSPNEMIWIAHEIRVLLTGSSLGSGEFATWLKETFDVPFSSVTDFSVLQAIHSLNVSLITTTNYDKLFSKTKLGMESITWQDRNLLLAALHSDDRVVHLHGVWDRPESVVFGSLDYDAILEDDVYQTFLRTLWVERTLVFIGCSFDGMNDPDFSSLLNWAANSFPHSTAKHYALVRNDSITPESSEIFLNRWRIQLVGYGSNHSDLAPFLDSLASPAFSEFPLPPLAFAGRADQIESVLDSVTRRSSLLVHGMGGIGKSALVSKAMSLLADRDPNLRAIWLDGTGKSLTNLLWAIGSRYGVSDIAKLNPNHFEMHGISGLYRESIDVVVIDNATDLEGVKQLSQRLASTGIASIVTSQARATGFHQRMEIGPLDEGSALTVFSELARTDMSNEIVRQICALVEYHPLALVVLAGRYEAGELPLERLLGRIVDEKHRLDTLRYVGEPETPSTSVRASLLVSMETLPIELVTTLTTLAYFEADTTIQLLAVARNLSEEECEDQVGQFARRSIVQRSPTGLLHLHALTKSSVRHRDTELSEFTRSRVNYAVMSLMLPNDHTGVMDRRRVMENIDNVIAFVRSEAPSVSSENVVVIVGIVTALCGPSGILDHYSTNDSFVNTADEIVRLSLNLAESLGDPDLIALLLFCQANVFQKLRRFEDAISVLARAGEITEHRAEAPVSVSAIKCATGNNLLALHRYPEAELAMREGLALAISTEEGVSIAQLTGQLGQVLLQAGKLFESETQYVEAKRLYIEENHPHSSLLGVAACASNLASIARKRGQSLRAWSLEIESLEADMQADNVVGALTSIEILAGEFSNDAQLGYLLETAQKLVHIIPHFTPDTKQALLRNLSAKALIKAVRYDEAKAFLIASLAHRERENDIRGAAVSAGRLSEVEIRRQMFADARTYNDLSREYYESCHDLGGVAICYHTAARIALEVRDYSDALDNAARSIEISSRSGDLEKIAATYDLFEQVIHSSSERSFPRQYPLEGRSLQELLTTIASDAQARDYGKMLGTVETMLNRYRVGLE